MNTTRLSAVCSFALVVGCHSPGRYGFAATYAPRDDEAQIEDPNREVSLIYHEGRAALEDRVWRLESGRSAASTPILRTAHSVTGAVLEGDPSSPTVHASWTCHVYDPKHRKQHVFFGRYEMAYKPEGADWRIARKKVVLLNDYIPTMIDFYCI